MTLDDTSEDENIYYNHLPTEESVDLSVDDSNACVVAESNSMNWVQIYPVNLTTKLVYCFKYLIPTGEYQEVCDLFNVVYNGIFNF